MEKKNKIKRQRRQKEKLIKEILIGDYIMKIYRSAKPTTPTEKDATKLVKPQGNRDRLRARFIELFGDDEGA